MPWRVKLAPLEARPFLAGQWDDDAAARAAIVCVKQLREARPALSSANRDQSQTSPQISRSSGPVVVRSRGVQGSALHTTFMSASRFTGTSWPPSIAMVLDRRTAISWKEARARQF